MAADKSKSSDKTQRPKTYKIELSPAAERHLEDLDRPIQTQVLRRIEKLADDPRPHSVEKLKGLDEDVYRVRAGDYRILYTIHDDELVVLVVKIGDRKEVYRRLPKGG